MNNNNEIIQDTVIKSANTPLGARAQNNQTYRTLNNNKYYAINNLGVELKKGNVVRLEMQGYWITGFIPVAVPYPRNYYLDQNIAVVATPAKIGEVFEIILNGEVDLYLQINTSNNSYIGLKIEASVEVEKLPIDEANKAIFKTKMKLEKYDHYAPLEENLYLSSFIVSYSDDQIYSGMFTVSEVFNDQGEFVNIIITYPLNQTGLAGSIIAGSSTIDVNEKTFSLDSNSYYLTLEWIEDETGSFYESNITTDFNSIDQDTTWYTRIGNYNATLNRITQELKEQPRVLDRVV